MTIQASVGDDMGFFKKLFGKKTKTNIDEWPETPIPEEVSNTSSSEESSSEIISYILSSSILKASLLFLINKAIITIMNRGILPRTKEIHTKKHISKINKIFSLKNNNYFLHL